MSELYVAATWSDGSVSHHAIQLEGRFPSQPKGGWSKAEGGLAWKREATDANIEYEMARYAFYRMNTDGLGLMGWRRLSQAEHDLFEQDRPNGKPTTRPYTGGTYRNALVDRAGKIEHDIVKARDCCREELRRQRRNAMLVLDGQWMGATGQGKKAEADAVEAERQKWRDAPADPRIDAAGSVEELKQIKVA